MISRTRRHTYLVFALLALACAVTAALLPRVRGEVDQHEALRLGLENVRSAESRFRELVVDLRHGMSGNYDEANHWLRVLHTERARLEAGMRTDAGMDAHWREYANLYARQDAAWNDFKRLNAVVRNSMLYLRSRTEALQRRLPDDARGLVLHHDLPGLGSTLYMYALGEKADNPAALAASIAALEALARPLDPDLRREVTLFARHARVIQTHAPELSRALTVLVHNEGRVALERLVRENARLLAAEQQLATRFRQGLLLAGLALLALVLHMGRLYLREKLQHQDDLQLTQLVVQGSQQGIVVTDSQGTILRVNDAYSRITGYPKEELLGRNPRILHSGLQGKAFYREMWDSLRTSGRWQGEMKNRRRDGGYYVQWTSISELRTEADEKLYVGVVSDISELVDNRERLASLAYYDTLTGLPNRVLFRDRLAQAQAHSHRGNEVFALILADLDNFKTINDTLGHDAGDRLLVGVAERLRTCVRESDTVARLSGDEFAVILLDAKGPEEVSRVAQYVLDVLAAPYSVHGYEFTCGASLGVTFWPADGDDPETLLKNADVAMYRAKENGRNNYQLFTGDMAVNVAETLRLESALRLALERGELAMHYQPQLTPSGQVRGMEALMRWKSAELGWISPARFIPVAERAGLISTLGDFALRESCRQIRDWRERLDRDLRVSVNLSSAQFRHEGLAERIRDLLDEHGLPGSALELEITESLVMEDVTKGQAMLARLKQLGCRIAIDDFGTGYSSLAYLQRFPVDVLKIDKSFIDGLGGQDDDARVSGAIIGLARSLGLALVAEGVETAVQLDVLRRLVGHEDFLAQGYLYSPALAPEEFEARYPVYRRLQLVG